MLFRSLEILENKNYYLHIKNVVNTNSPEILTRMIYDFIARKENNNENLFTEGFLNEIRKDIIAFERKGDAPLSTHHMDERNNELINALKNAGLSNKKDDAVKVIVEPVYLDGTDGLIELPYYDAMVGCHLGLFPSYYEPWGYTPVESAALGVPSMTTDLSGFGMFVKDKIKYSETLPKNGVYVLERYHRNENDVIEEFVNILYNFSRMTHAERVECKLSARKIAALADWDIMIENYIKAHNMAVSKLNK